MSQAAIKYYCCVVCTKRLKPKEKRPLSGPHNKGLRKFLAKAYLLHIKDSDFICGSCRIKSFKLSKNQMSKSALKNPVNDVNSNDAYYSPHVARTVGSPKRNVCTLPLKTPLSSHAYCFICRKPGPKLIVVPANPRYEIFVQTSILLPAGIRCCPSHLVGERFTNSAIYSMCNGDRFKTETNFTTAEILTLLNNVRNIALKSKSKRLDFDDAVSLKDADYHNLIGLSRDHFNDLCSYISNIRDTKVRSPRTCVGILLVKLRSGLSNKLLSSLFNVSKYTIRRSLKAARKSLLRSPESWLSACDKGNSY